MHRLIKTLKNELLIIRKAYKNTFSLENEDFLTQWLQDNYYILEREAKGVIKELKSNPPLPKVDKLPRLYSLSLHICENGILPDFNSLDGILNQSHLSVAESESLVTMLKAALISHASNECKRYPKGRNEKDGQGYCINAIKSFRKIGDISFSSLIEKTSEVEKILSKDPSGDYINMDDTTRSAYRHAIARLAKQKKISEKDAAEQVLNRAKKESSHIGSMLNLYPQKPSNRARVTIALEIILPLLLCFILAYVYKVWYVFFVFLLPIWEITKIFTDRAASERAITRPLPRMELSGKVPDEARTLITISTLLPQASKALGLEKHLSQLYRSNAKGSVSICVLADLKASQTPTKASDEADIDAFKRLISKLNTKYNGGFILAVRPRVFSKTEGEYTGKERKRGAILALCEAIKGKDDEFLCLYGDLENLSQTKYIMALDSDTQMPLASLSQLVSCAVHPLNKPILNKDETQVIKGYGVFCPRIETSIESAAKTSFTQSMSGSGGITAYNSLVPNKYQDLFHSGLFTGKGLIDVDIMHRLLKDRLPSQRVLSHDILEGEICKTATINDVELTDSFPSNQDSFMARLHRWVRGDWQNLIFIFPYIRLDGRRTRNPLKGISRFKVFDNIRRSLSPAISVVLLISSFFMSDRIAFLTFLLVLLSSALPHIITSIASLFSGGISLLSRLYYSSTIPSALDSIIKAVLSVMMLAQSGFVCIDAISRALYRQFISKKNMLQWVTAADADSESSFNNIIKKYWHSGLLGFLLIFFSMPLGRLLGIAFLFNIVYSILSAKEISPKQKKISKKNKEKLISYAAAMWKFYDEFCRSGDNFLPPDNVQETPVHRIAHRSSPTNIGLMLCCILSARDLGFIDSRSMYVRLKNSLDSIERLEKWHGNLLNWYNTKTLQPLEPKYCSAVDMGNYLCCLVSLYQGLSEYIADYPQIQELRQRIARQIKECDISVFYNKQRSLFHIGYDFGENSLSNSYYDLLMSEARMLSYFAVSTQSVPKKHWAALGRTLAKDGRYIGPISWTGTMFEYFMPCLFIPAPQNTLIAEGLRFCLRCQKNRTKDKAIPYGISESGFYAFDAQMNYQYKAHGVQKLGLKRKLNSDLVISPYSTFLTLSLDADAAIKNLKALEGLDITGRYGFYEAVDFTKSRIEGQEYAVVRSYMAHHIGMSMLSILNLIENNKMQKRFMKDERMAAGISLLEEKIPSEAVVFKDIEKREMPSRPERYVSQDEEFNKISPLQPRLKLLSNGEWSTIISDSGISASLYRGADITRRTFDSLENPLGIFAAIKTKADLIPLSKAPFYNNDVYYQANFKDNNVSLYAKKSSIECKTEIMLHKHQSIEQRNYNIKNNSKKPLKCKLLIYFEPSLSHHTIESSHFSFTNLFLKSAYNEHERLIVFNRNSRNSPEKLSLAVGFCENINFVFDTSREDILKRPYGTRSLFSENWQLNNRTGRVDNCCAIEVKLEIPPRGSKSLNLILSAASTIEEASEKLLKIRHEKGIKLQRSAYSPFKTGSLDTIAAEKVLSQVFLNTRMPKQAYEALEKNESGIDALWQLSISGDEPIICVYIDTAEDISNAIPFIRLNKKLSRCSILTSLVLIYNEAEIYVTDFMSKLREVLIKENCEQLLFNKGGIIPINQKTAEPQSLNAILAASVYVFPESEELSSKVFKEYVPAKIHKGEADTKAHNTFLDNSYIIAEKPSLPWSFTLSNPSFGTLVTDSSPGYTWAINSRENKLSPWSNNTMLDLNGERLYFRIGGNIYSALENATAAFSSERAVYTGKIGKLYYNVQIHVPQKGMKKEIYIRLTNEDEKDLEIEIAYYIEGLLSDLSKNARFVKQSVEEDNTILMRSPYNAEYRGSLALSPYSSAGEAEHYVCQNKINFLTGLWNKKDRLSKETPCAASIFKINLSPNKDENISYTLSFGKNVSAAKAIMNINPPKKEQNTISLYSQDANLNNLFNSFLIHQIISTRIEARTAFYQCGGAYGFRDQLQDTSALVLTHPDIVKRQILRCCAVQFREGDVLHWWHVVPNPRFHVKGVRTRYSDDLLWLAYVTAEYVQKTGDTDFLKTETPYIEAAELNLDEHDRFFKPDMSKDKASVYEHCKQAIKRSSRLGSHGLPLIGGGDWNDSFNKVGEKGRGESVWLGMFLALTLKEFAKVAEMIGDTSLCQEYQKKAEELIENLDKHAWNGKWYIRAFYDDGSAMGDIGADECEIDLLPQSFAVLADMPNHERRKTALKNAYSRLVDKENGIIKLFSPPFKEQGKETGYVNAYPEGIRENGGQYSHASMWFVKALFKEDMIEEAWQAIKILNPANKYNEPKTAAKYKTEPYAFAGDVYSAKGMEGRGGWSLYTGAAGWFYRAIYEDMLGIKQEKGKISVHPKTPQELRGAKFVLNINGEIKEYEI